MRRSSKLLIIAGIAGVAALTAMRFWRIGQLTQRTLESGLSESNPSAASETNNSPSFSNIPTGSTHEGWPANSADQTDDWPDRVDAILASNVPESDKVRQFLEMFPNLPEAGEEAVASHLSNLLPNEQYDRMAVFFTNDALAPEVLAIFMRDALNRPNSVKLPVLLEVARNPKHSKAGEARETLAYLLGEDDGDDWAKWQTKMEQWLQANPD